MTAFGRIPEELRVLDQWVVWRSENIGAKKPTKVPYNAKSGKPASVINSANWGSFFDCVKIAQSETYSGIGFVFTDNDPYTFIDLDDTDGDKIALERQLKVYREFDSYSEISPSGNGLHIIVKGNIPAGRRRSYIEIYSTARYATFTGNVYNDKPIVDRQELLNQLWQQMGSGGPATLVYNGQDKEIYNDEQIIEQGKNAANGDKFVSLLSGRWQDLYPSQSEADFAFIDIIAFYTQNKNQIIRIFRNSSLGKRDKAKRDVYISRMIDRSFDRMLPPIDLDGWHNALNEKLASKIIANASIAQLVEPVAHNGFDIGSTPITSTNFLNKLIIESEVMPVDTIHHTNPDISPSLQKAGNGDQAVSSNGRTPDFDSVNTGSNPVAAAIILPPGLMGEIAQFIYQSAPRSAPEIALAGAIGLLAGICGRAYNISGTGLNQYVLCIANTGSGKESMSLGIDKLMNLIRLQVPTANRFIGPSEIASGQALVKHLNKTSACFVSILGEFGLRLQSMSSQRANSVEIGLRRMLLDLYNKSGNGQTFRASIYSDRDKNIEATNAPAFTILGESTPERFYGALNEDMISEGLLPRFMLIEYTGLRPPLNENHLTVVPSFQLTDQLSGLVANVEMIMHANRVINVNINNDAEKLLHNFDKFSDNQINSTDKELVKQLWNRAHIKVLKLSALIAVGVNMSDPIVLPEYVIWAINMVQSDIKALSKKFELGEVGSNSFESKQLIEMTKIIKKYLTEPYEKAAKYQVTEELFYSKIIPYAYLSKRLIATAAFRNDRAGSTIAIKRALQTLIDSDKIREVGKSHLQSKFGTTQRAFMLSDMRLLD